MARLHAHGPACTTPGQRGRILAACAHGCHRVRRQSCAACFEEVARTSTLAPALSSWLLSGIVCDCVGFIFVFMVTKASRRKERQRLQPPIIDSTFWLGGAVGSWVGRWLAIVLL